MLDRKRPHDAGQPTQARGTSIARTALRGVHTLLTVLAIASAMLTAYLLLILAGPSAAQEVDAAQAASAPPTASVAAQWLPLPEDAASLAPARLPEALRLFGHPVLALPGETGYALRAIAIEDMPAPSARGKVRAIHLTYQYGSTDAQLILSSFTPTAYAQTLAGTSLSLSLSQDYMIAGMRAVYMAGANTLHLHMQSEDCVYQIEGMLHIDDFRRAASMATLYVAHEAEGL